MPVFPPLNYLPWVQAQITLQILVLHPLQIAHLLSKGIIDQVSGFPVRFESILWPFWRFLIGGLIGGDSKTSPPFKFRSYIFLFLIVCRMSHKITSLCCCCLENISKYCYNDLGDLVEKSNGILIPQKSSNTWSLNTQ